MKKKRKGWGKEIRSSTFATLLYIRPLIVGDTDVDEEQLFGALRCN